jgi:hypothetical protein
MARSRKTPETPKQQLRRLAKDNLSELTVDQITETIVDGRFDDLESALSVDPGHAEWLTEAIRRERKKHWTKDALDVSPAFHAGYMVGLETGRRLRGPR